MVIQILLPSDFFTDFLLIYRFLFVRGSIQKHLFMLNETTKRFVNIFINTSMRNASFTIHYVFVNFLRRYVQSLCDKLDGKNITPKNNNRKPNFTSTAFVIICLYIKLCWARTDNKINNHNIFIKSYYLSAVGSTQNR